jgi:hypothetical protein
VIKISLKIERSRSIGTDQVFSGDRQRQIHPLLVLAFFYAVVGITSIVTGDKSLLLDFTRDLIRLSANLFVT